MSRQMIKAAWMATFAVVLSGVGLVPATASTDVAPPAAEVCGDRWRIVAAESPGTIATVLLGVAATSDGVAWAVGHRSYFDEDGLYAVSPVIERWDGADWSLAYSPDTAGQLAAVVAFAPDDVWAVGHSGGPESTEYVSMIMHWNGDRWRRVKAPRITLGYLLSVGGSGPDDIWAAGATIGDFRTIVQHWNGTRWRKVRHPATVSDYVVLTGIAATGPDDAWLVGSYLDAEAADAPLALHWNGTRIRRTHPVSPDGLPTALADVAAGPGGGVWAVGTATGEGGVTQAVVERWTSSGWALEPTEDVDSAHLLAVTSGPDSEWAAGWRQGADAAAPVIMKRQSGTWRSVTAPSGEGDTMLLAIDQSTADMWAVGFQRPEEQSALTMRRRPTTG
jgi:hypothetical protein